MVSIVTVPEDFVKRKNGITPSPDHALVSFTPIEACLPILKSLAGVIRLNTNKS
jgi:hypothetical protein